jgi:hypothetical protein
MRCSAVGALLLLVHSSVAAQAPTERWMTLRTEHFNVHFARGLEAPGRRAAAAAEAAYSLLASELVPPRGPIELVIADNVDFSNGYATVYPTNRIVVFLHPPVQGLALRNYADWLELVIAHELTHVFHLDRTRGWWRVAQRVFGRNPLLFPNVYLPTWLLEGLAVYYETKLTGSGRLAGTHHRMVVRTAAVAGAVPRLVDLNPGSSRFPHGELPYVYGSLLFDYLARTRGEQTIPAFVERASGMPLPLLARRAARRSFGVSFTEAFREWRDSVLRAAPADREPLPGWRQLTREGRYAFFPRWHGDSLIVFAAATGREMPGVYSVDLKGHARRLGRINSIDVTVPTESGEVFAQHDFTDLYDVRSDLFMRRNGVERRLTRGQRLSHPDVCPDGGIVAVQATGGTTRLVRVSSNGREISELAGGTPDRQWAEPRCSPTSARVAAVRIAGGVSQIVVFDTLGIFGVVREVAGGTGAVYASPAWSPDGRRIFFSADETRGPQIYILNVDKGTYTAVSDASTGIFQPEPSPNGAMLAANHYRVDGHHIGAAPLPLSPMRWSLVEGPEARMPRRAEMAELVAVARATLADAPVRQYSPWPSILPRYWFPLLARTEGTGTSIGAFTSGMDVVGRHAYAAQALVKTRNRETDASAIYRYAGLGQPILDLTFDQEWLHSSVIDSSRAVVGDLGERERAFGIWGTLLRPRIRTFASATAGLQLETRRFRTSPDTLQPLLAEPFRSGADYRVASLAAAWTNTQRPALAISLEDGVALSSLVERRWQSGVGSAGSTRAIAAAAAYKSLDFPGFAHHVLALRAAGGITDSRTTSFFSAGGVSGTLIAVLPGYGFGEGRRTFGLRGYPPGAQRGTRAHALTAEYRIPIAAPSRRLPLVPVFLDKISAAAFFESARAYCPRSHQTICGAIAVDNPVLSSIGAEINFDTPAQLLSPYRLRLGFAHPLRLRERYTLDALQWYGTFGLAF